MQPDTCAAPAEGLAGFTGGSLPAPEGRARSALIRTVAVTALVVSLAYLAWRATATLDLSVWWVSLPLLALEAHAVLGLGLFTFSLWDVDPPSRVHRRRHTDLRVAVLIPTYNEPEEVLLPAIAAAVAIQPPHETWVLDDGARPNVEALAERLGARYLARTDRSHAKAGNLNHALQVVNADLVAVLDADHVAGPGFLTNTLAYFDDPRVAVVQTPQDFYNLDSFEHEPRHDDEGRFNEQALFYRVLQAGKNRWGAAFWCGTGAVVRVAALREVGGVATETITEDIHTTIRFHRRGWKSVYHNEVVARGLAASDAQQYQAQRLRWGTGAMQVLRIENPLWCRGLRLPQRLAYAATLLGWFDAWRSLGYLLVPMAVLATGAVPIRTDPLLFLAAFGTSFALQRAAIVLLARGRAPQILTSVFEMVRMVPNLQATLTLLGRRARRFEVTRKGRMADGRTRRPVPAMLITLLAGSVATAAWFGLTAAGLTPVTYREPWAAYGAAGWLAVNGALLWLAIGRIRAERFGGERRASVRFDVELNGTLAGRHCRVLDLSLTGARVVLPRVPGASGYDGELVVAGIGARLRATARTGRVLGDGTVLVGLRFEPGQDEEQARLALALFNAERVPRLVAGELPEAVARAG